MMFVFVFISYVCFSEFFGVSFFFFSSRRRHTRFDCDWSSDVCSSDLEQTALCVEVLLAKLVAFVLVPAELRVRPGERERGADADRPLRLGGKAAGDDTDRKSVV